MKQIKRIIFIPFLFLFILGFSSCSYLLNMALIPFAPDFVPEIEMTSDGAKIYYTLSTEKRVSKDDSQDWERDYAYYIWRSTENPYNNFELIKRVYISELSQTYTGYTKNKSNSKKDTHTYDFRIPEESSSTPEGERINLKFSSNGYIIDKTPLTRTCYYRVSKITLNSSHISTEDYESLSYFLLDKTSGWLSFGGSN